MYESQHKKSWVQYIYKRRRSLLDQIQIDVSYCVNLELNLDSKSICTTVGHTKH